MAFYYLMNGDNDKVADIKIANWLVVGTNPEAEQIPVGENDRDMAGVAIRSFNDGIAHGIYSHPETKVGEHYYANAKLNVLYAENVGFKHVNGDWRQVNIIDYEPEYIELTPTVEFPNGPKLRILKHKMFNMLLQGYSFKIWIAHLRQYILDQKFIMQWDLLDEGKKDAAAKIRWDNINKARAGRRVRAAIREDDNGNAPGKSNWEQVQAQLAQGGNMEDGIEEPAEGADEEAPGISPAGSRTLMIKTYANREIMVNMFDLPMAVYTLRVSKIPYPFPWNPGSSTSVEQWTKFSRKPTWSIDLLSKFE